MSIKVYCVNTECVNNKGCENGKVRVVVDPNTYDLVPENKVCSLCGSLLEIEHIGGFSANVPSFASLSDQQKKDVLKSRAMAEYNKRGKEERIYRQRKVLGANYE